MLEKNRIKSGETNKGLAELARQRARRPPSRRIDGTKKTMCPKGKKSTHGTSNDLGKACQTERARVPLEGGKFCSGKTFLLHREKTYNLRRERRTTNHQPANQGWGGEKANVRPYAKRKGNWTKRPQLTVELKTQGKGEKWQKKQTQIFKKSDKRKKNEPSVSSTGAKTHGRVWASSR